jgi:hypothetical protein
MNVQQFGLFQIITLEEPEIKKHLTKWIVSHGPDASHLQDVKSFDKLKDAKEFVDSLDDGRDFKIEKQTYESDVSVGKNELVEKGKAGAIDKDPLAESYNKAKGNTIMLKRKKK